MAKVYQNPGQYAYGTFEEAAAAAMTLGQVGWIYEMRETLLQNDRFKDYVGYFYLPNQNERTFKSMCKEGFLPVAQVKLQIHPMFTGALVNE